MIGFYNNNKETNNRESETEEREREFDLTTDPLLITHCITAITEATQRDRERNTATLRRSR